MPRFEVRITVDVPDGHSLVTQHDDPTQPLIQCMKDSTRPWKQIGLEVTEIAATRLDEGEAPV